ncbi:glycosyltransferase family 2 protein, partial [Thiolapillus sp.]
KKQPSVAIFGSTLLDENGLVVECAGGSYYSPCLSTYKHALKGLTIEEAAHAELPKPLDYIEGAAMFVRAEVFRTIGLFNEEYFLYFEELDLIRRLPSGSHIDWCKKSFVRHIGGASMESKVAEYHSNVSALMYTRKYHPYCFPFMAVFRFTAKLFRNILTGSWSLNEALVSSYKHYFLSR